MEPCKQPQSPKLTAREKEIVACMAEYLPTNKIAARLFISPKTVYNHRENIMKKLSLTSILELVEKWKQGELQ